MRQNGIVQRLGSGPVIDSGDVPGYGPIFNPGLVHFDGRFHLFARAVRDEYRPNAGAGPRFSNYVSDVLLFSSTDGIDYRLENVLLAAGNGGAYAYEDPRVQRVRSNAEERLVMTYTHLPVPESGRPWRIGLLGLEYRDGRFTPGPEQEVLVGPEGHEDKDGVVFNLRDGRVALLHRLYPNMQLAVFDSLEDLMEPGAGYWDEHLERLEELTILRPDARAYQVGAGAPPVETEDGLLLFYHERTRRGVYTMNVALLDDLTGRVKARVPDPILVPETAWERQGDTDEVVFVQGAHRLEDGRIYLVYGAADRRVGAAVVNERRLLALLRSS